MTNESSEIDTLHAANQRLEACHSAVINECMAVEGCLNEEDPAATIKALVDWHCGVVQHHADLYQEDLLRQIKVMELALQQIVDNYANPNINHVDYRVHARKCAEAALRGNGGE